MTEIKPARLEFQAEGRAEIEVECITISRRDVLRIAGGVGLGVVLAGSVPTGLSLAQGTPNARLEASPEASPVTGGMKTIDTVAGSATIPLDPQRVIVMENRVDLEIAVALGLPIVGVGVYFGAFGTADDYVNPWIPFVPGPEVIVFNTAEPDLEEIIQIRPDLNISRIYYLDGTFGFDYETLAPIAPIIPVDYTETEDGFYGWREELLVTADFLNRGDLVAEPIAEYDALLNDVKTRHADKIESAQIAVLSYAGDSQYFVNDTSMFATVLKELGGAWYPIPTDVDGMLSIEQSNELADADAILLWGEGNDFELVAEFDVWNALPQVRDGKVVEASVMTNFGSVYAAQEVLRKFDEVYTLLD